MAQTDQDWSHAKVVGRRLAGLSRPGDLVAVSGFLDLLARMGPGRILVPRGVYRFNSFEEADRWWITVMKEKASAFPARQQ